ncbi:MAG: alpha/beta hydrolase [Pirellulales bacterium]
MTGDWQRICGALAAVLAIVGAQICIAASPPLPTDASSAEAALGEAALTTSPDCGHFGMRSWLRAKIVRESDLANFGLRLDEDWRNQPREKPVVILIHGFNSTLAKNATMLAPIRAAQIPCGTFAYPNDHDISTSAQLLACELHRFSKLYPDRRVILLCHSMGGMVARACVENPSTDPGNVVRLIMIAPPSHGTVLAHFAVGSDLWEHWLARKSGGPWQRTRDSIIDGLGEAADELCPNSDFLTELNGRPRNPRVKYSILLGTGALMSEPQLAWIRQSVCDGLARLPGSDGSVEKLDAILNDIDELVDGKGDGVVAVKRGRLENVSDTLILPFGHLAVTGEPRDDVLRRVEQAVLVRVQ